MDTWPQPPCRRPGDTHLQVALGGEGSPAHVAHEGLLPGVGPLVNLERARRREVLPAPRAPVLPGLSAWLSRQQRRHARGHGRGSERTRGFDFDVGWLGSDKRRGQTAPAWQAEREKKKKSQTFIIPHSLALQAKKKKPLANHCPEFERLEKAFGKLTPWRYFPLTCSPARRIIMRLKTLRKTYRFGVNVWATRKHTHPSSSSYSSL